MIVQSSLDQNTRQLRKNSILIFSLLIIAMGSIAYGISYLTRDLTLDKFFLIFISALLVSWVLAQTEIQDWMAVFLLILLGVLLTFLSVGDLWGLLFTLFRTGFVSVFQKVFLMDGVSQEPNVIWLPLNEIMLRSNTIFFEFDLWLKSIFSGNPVYYYNAVYLVWSFAIWSISAWAGWIQRRKENPLIAAFPGGLVLAIILGYTYGKTTALYPFVFAVLSLIGLSFYQRKEWMWKIQRMDYPEGEHSENAILIFSITFVFVILSIVVSQLSFGRAIEILRTWIDPQIEQSNQILDSLGFDQRESNLGNMAEVKNGGLPREHLIGSGPELSDQVVLRIQIEDDPTSERLSIGSINTLKIPLYWRGISYDRYNGFGWMSSDVEIRTYQSNEIANQLDLKSYRILRQNIRSVETDELIYAVGEIVSLDKEYSIAWRKLPGSSEPPTTPGDIFAGSINTFSYQVDSMFPVVSEDQLIAAQDPYPNWVLERYLSLPDNISDRVINLARELTRNAPTTLHKSQAIETYLRTYEYELNLPAPPINRELSDYFLFELKKGYCDYYATSMVVLARAVGIPARIAIGYSQGSFDSETQSYVVAMDNAHSWVEIFFSGIGWVKFEPTPAQPIIKRSSLTQNLETNDELFDLASVREFPIVNFLDRFFYGLGGIICLIMIFPLFWYLIDNLYLRWVSHSRMLKSIFGRLYRFGSNIGTPSDGSLTPNEFVTLLENKFQIITQYSRWKPYLLKFPNEIERISHSYVTLMYSPNPLSTNDIKHIITTWNCLRIKLILVRLIYTWQNILQNKGHTY